MSGIAARRQAAQQQQGGQRDRLQGSEFADLRKQVEQQFELRAKTSNVAGTTQKIHTATQEMSSILRQEIEKVPANEYIAARKFLDGLDYTARTGSI